MGIADDVKKLGEDIVASYDTRVKAIGALVKDTHKMLNNFTSDRMNMSVKQANALASFVTALTKKVNSMLNGFQKEHKEMSIGLSKSLSDFVNGLVKNVGNMMKHIQKDHKEMSDALSESLEKGETNRLKDFKS